MRKKEKRVNKLILLIRIISVIVIVISLYYIYLWYEDNKNTEEIVDNIFENANILYEDVILDNDMKTSLANVEFDKLININSDTVGWIRVLGTDINYPVVQTSDNNFYLNHSFDKSYNKSGWIFADYTNTNLKINELDKNTVIYGHNRQNNTMFGTLSNTLKEGWRKEIENQYINFSTLNKNMVWQVFSTYTIDSEDYYIQTKFASNTDYEKFLNTLKNRSTYNFNVNLSKEDKILTLSTCTNIGEGRTVVHAKLIEIEK